MIRARMALSILKHLQAAIRGAPAQKQSAGAAAAGAASPRRKTLAPSDGLCAITDVGQARERNEDVVHLSEDGRIMIVADGMGGHDAGEVASAMAVATIAEHLGAVIASLPGNDDGSALVQAMRSALEAAQDRVLAAGNMQEGGHGMGCTLILACLQGDTLYLCHVGDTRAYLWSEGELRALTRDHSVLAELLATGELTAEQARGHTSKNEVLQAIGMPAGFDPDINVCPLRSGERVLLCSDGLWDMLSDQEIASVAGTDGSMRQLATLLVDRANDAGGHDNISVVLYEHCAPAVECAGLENVGAGPPSGKQT